MRQCGNIVLGCTQGLCRAFQWLSCLLCCWYTGNKVSAASETLRIEVGVVDESDKKKHNRIKTSKYTLLTFLPKNLAGQFRRVANFYFLVVTFISIVIDSPVSPLTSIAPLSFMVLVTAAKQGYEDWLRHKEDNKVNNQVVEIVHKGVIKNVRNCLIAPGTLVRVKRGKEVPADLVLLCSAQEKGKCYVTTANLDGETNLKTLRVPTPLVGFTPEKGKCYVTTANLDGETNLKTLRVPTPLVGFTPGESDQRSSELSEERCRPGACSVQEKGKCYVTTANLDGETNLKTLRVPSPLVGFTPDILPQGMRIEIPHNIADLYTFYGRLDIPGLDSIPLGTDNLMLRGSRVKNTEWAIGCAVYTGEQTKLALNSKYTGNKFSSCELATNTFLGFFILLLILEITGCTVAKIMVEERNRGMELYLGPLPSFPPPIGSLVQDICSFLLLYYYIIPMSLYVTIELNKFLGTYFIGWDEELRCEETGRPALANTSDLNEDLGQVEVLFSDKTGTLTKNLMVFKACTIRGHVFEERESRLYDTERFEEPVCCNNIDVKFFFTILALCHTVQISNEDMKRLSARLSLTFDNPLKFMRRKKSSKIPNGNGNGAGDNISWDALLGDNLGKMEYQGSSPDEKALVEAADRIGVSFLGEDGNNMLVKIGDHTEMYERLQLIDFTSERKRMSIILRDKDGKIWLFCKGAESSVFPLCKDSALIEDTDRDINVFANKGLRTLAIAYREIPEEEYNKISESIQKLDTTKVESLQLVTQQYRVLERQLTLIGATAVEDCLQDDVADTLAALRRAAIKIWVLTGDKVETAINVAQSCAHISENDRRMFLIGVEDDVALQAHVTECRRIISEPSFRELTLIVDGTSMSQILDTDYAKHFVEISMQCHAVLCCRLSPIQKAKIVKLIKNSKDRPVTAAIGDGANDISMIQEAHVGFGIFGREGHQAARSADFAFTKFSMIKKVLLVIGHWYYQRLATLIHYFFYKNLVLGNIMLFFQFQSAFSTQSIYDSLFLTIYNLVLTSVPVLLLSITEQRWPSNLLLKNPTLYREIARNRLMSWWYFSSWTLAAVYHSVVIYLVSYFVFRIPVINGDAKTVDLWSFGSLLFHLNVVIVNLKLWLQARYHTLIFVGSVLLSILAHVAITAVYSLLNLQYDGDVLGTYTRLLASLPFWIANVVVVIAALAPDLATRLISDRWGRRVEAPAPTQSAFVSRL